MPKRDSVANTAQRSKSLRRSPRFFHPTNNPEPEAPTTTLRRSPRRVSQGKTAAESENPRTPNFKPRSNPIVKCLNSPLSSPALRRSQRLVSLGKTTAESENPRTPNSKSRSNGVVKCLNSPVSFKKSSKPRGGSRKSSRLNSGVDGSQSLRRSARILNLQPVIVDVSNDLPERVSKKLGEFDNGSSNCRKLSSRSRKSRAKSAKLCIEQPIVVGERTGKATQARSKSKINGSVVKEEISDLAKDGGQINLQQRVQERSKRATRRSSAGVEMVCSPEKVSQGSKMVTGRSSVGLQMVSVEDRKLDAGNKQVEVKRKRKRDEEGVDHVQRWTKEQELALERAYLVANPTPHFWKKVSKMVPGKSAQECFDKVNSEHMTPPQPRTRSRANVLARSSPIGQFSISASKLLKPTEPKSRRPNCSKQKSHIAQKTLRKLLEKHYQVYQDSEADLFSVFEPSLGPSTPSQPSVILSTPKSLQKKQGLLGKGSRRSSPGHKKPLSRFSSCETPLVSPPVLKRVRNKVLHEKYIDQLHNREAKRKAASTWTQKSTVGIEDRNKNHVQEVDEIRSAKIALVSDARDAIYKLQHIQANVTSNSSDLDEDDCNVSDDEEGDDDT